jgi:hypothetical protein
MRRRNTVNRDSDGSHFQCTPPAGTISATKRGIHWARIVPWAIALLVVGAVARQRFFVVIPVRAREVTTGDVVIEVFGRGTIESRRDVQLGFDTVGGIGDLLVDEGARVKLGMAGIYGGLVDDATVLVRALHSDLWVVQKSTRGPFADISRVAPTLEKRVAGVAGVRIARAFTFQVLERPYAGRSLRFALVGLSWTEDRGRNLPLVADRALGQSHGEIIADVSLGLPIGSVTHLATEDFTVVGLTRQVLCPCRRTNGSPRQDARARRNGAVPSRRARTTVGSSGRDT